MIAAQVGNYKIVKVLLQYGADPTIVTCAGDTALSIGARVKHYVLVMFMYHLDSRN